MTLQATTASGFFEVQILSLTNNRGTLVDGRCCGGGGGGGGFPPCTTPCSTIFWLCLKEYQSNVTAIGSCSFGNVSSHALGTNTFTLVEPTTLQLHFTFRWTVSCVSNNLKCPTTARTRRYQRLQIFVESRRKLRHAYIRRVHTYKGESCLSTISSAFHDIRNDYLANLECNRALRRRAERTQAKRSAVASAERRAASRNIRENANVGRKSRAVAVTGRREA